MKETTLKEMMAKKSGEELSSYAVKGMLPKGPLRKIRCTKNLFVYAGPDHKHAGSETRSSDILIGEGGK